MPKKGPFSTVASVRSSSGKQQEAAERDQVLDGELIGQDEPVGSGNRDAALFQRPQQVADKLVAAAHQHHDVAGAHRAAARLQSLARFEPSPDRRGDGAGDPGARLGDAMTGDRQRRGIGRLLRERDRRRATARPARMAGAGREMTYFGAVERDPVMRRRVPKNGVDGAQHRLGRAERDLQRHDAPVLPGGVDARLEMTAHLEEGARIGPLKAVDRLFCVADREYRAQAIARALAGKEFFGERGDDLPLLGVGVLSLVDQNVIEAAIELEQYPRRNSGAPQQVQRQGHEIVVIEHPLGSLALGIRLDQRAAEPDQGTARIRQRRRSLRIPEALYPFRFGREDFAGIASGRPRGLPGDQNFTDLALGGEEHAGVVVENAIPPFPGRQPSGNGGAVLPVRWRAFCQSRRSSAQPRFLTGAQSAKTCDECFLGGPLLYRQRGLQPVAQFAVAAAQNLAELAALGGERRHQGRKAFFGGMAGDYGERLGQLPVIPVARGGDQALAGLDQRFPAAALVHHRKFRRHARLQRKTPQQGLAEGMKRRDLDPARGVEHPGKELPRPSDRRIIGETPRQLL